MNARQVALKHGFKSGLEDRVNDELTDSDLVACVEYESMVLAYEAPAKQHKYTPDFIVTTRSGKLLIIETKGRWLLADRKKMALVIEQHPDLDIRMVFTNPRTKISKGSPTSYGDWCDKLGIPYATKSVPEEWLSE